MSQFYEHISPNISKIFSDGLQDLAVHLSKELDTDINDIVKAIDSFSLSSKQKPTVPEKNNSPKKSDTQQRPKGDILHKCDYIPQGKTEKCGKNAKNELDGKWYCGTEISGHFSSIKKSANKKVPPKKTEGSIKSSGVPKKFSKNNVLHLIEIGDHTIEQETRICLDRENQEGYGVLDKDNITVKPLTDENIKFLSAYNYKVREKKNKAPLIAKKVVPPNKTTPESEDEEDEQEEVVVKSKTKVVPKKGKPVAKQSEEEEEEEEEEKVVVKKKVENGSAKGKEVLKKAKVDESKTKPKVEETKKKVETKGKKEEEPKKKVKIVEPEESEEESEEEPSEIVEIDDETNDGEVLEEPNDEEEEEEGDE